MRTITSSSATQLYSCQLLPAHFEQTAQTKGLSARLGSICCVPAAARSVMMLNHNLSANGKAHLCQSSLSTHPCKVSTGSTCTARNCQHGASSAGQVATTWNQALFTGYEVASGFRPQLAGCQFANNVCSRRAKIVCSGRPPHLEAVCIRIILHDPQMYKFCYCDWQVLP